MDSNLLEYAVKSEIYSIRHVSLAKMPSHLHEPEKRAFGRLKAAQRGLGTEQHWKEHFSSRKDPEGGIKDRGAGMRCYVQAASRVLMRELPSSSLGVRGD